jgi:hypothetical protein
METAPKARRERDRDGTMGGVEMVFGAPGAGLRGAGDGNRTRVASLED